MADPVPAISKEGFGAKLRRLAATQASLGGGQFFPLRPPLKAPALWARSSPVQSGEVRSANGHWYVCGKTGVTAATGNGPAAAATSALVVDNTTNWAFLCAAPAIPAGPAPVITTEVAPAPAGLPNFYSCVALPEAFRVIGAYPAPYASKFWQLPTFNSGNGVTTGVTSRLSFVTDAPKFAIGATNDAGPVRVMIDGRYVEAGGLTYARGGSPTWIVLDFSTAGGRMIRTVTVEFTFVHTFAGVAVSGVDSVWAPAAPDTVRCAFIADSLMSGSGFGPFLPGGDALSYMSRILGWDDCWNCSVAGTGYIANGGGGAYTYGQRIAELLGRKPDIWAFMGSTNDIGSAPAVQAAALAAFQAIRAGGSTAPIVVFGVWSIENYGLAPVEAAIGAAVTQFADPLRQTFFIPIYGDPVLPWITGKWNNSKDANSANAGLYIGSDGIHPTEIGTMFEGVRLANAIAARVLPNLA